MIACSVTGADTASTTIRLLNQIDVISPTLVVLSCDAEIAAFGLFAPNTNLVVTTTGADVMLASTTSNAAGNRMLSTIRKAAELKESISPANVKSTVTVVR